VSGRCSCRGGHVKGVGVCCAYCWREARGEGGCWAVAAQVAVGVWRSAVLALSRYSTGADADGDHAALDCYCASTGSGTGHSTASGRCTPQSRPGWVLNAEPALGAGLCSAARCCGSCSALCTTRYRGQYLTGEVCGCTVLRSTGTGARTPAVLLPVLSGYCVGAAGWQYHTGSCQLTLAATQQPPAAWPVCTLH
jgi:hypothetical protein